MRTNNQEGTDYPASVLHYLKALVDRRDYAGATRYYETNRDVVESSGGPLAGTILHVVAGAYASLSDYPAALRAARTAQNILAKEGDSLPQAELFLTLGGILGDAGEYKEAEKALRDAESIFRRKDCTEGQCRALNALAGLFFRVQELRNALSFLLEAMSIARQLGDREKVAFMMGNIGRIYTFIGSFAEAEKHLQIDLELSAELGHWLEVTRAHLSLGYLYIQAGEYEKAEAELSKAYPLVIEQNRVRNEVLYLTYLGELKYRQGQFHESESALKKALELTAGKAAHTTLAGSTLRHLAELYIRTCDFRKAQRYEAQAMAIMEGTGNKVETGALWKIRATLAGVNRQFEDSRLCFLKAFDLLTQSEVRFEKADALVAAGCSPTFSSRERVGYLFHAQELFAYNKLAARVAEIERLIAAIDYPRSSSADAPAVAARPEHEFRTNCPTIKSFLAQLPAIGRSDLPVLLTGETGVGKDHLARHYHSVCRPGRPFLAINCASVPETLLESELFGFKRGTFTGADADKQGLFLAANGGVLYLDEIGDMPLSLQAKLLGVLENRKVLPLGSTREVDLDVKLVLATNRNLEAMVESGAFRRDLFYRISGIPFCIPPLRQRKEDISLLLNHFMKRCSLLEENEKAPAELVGPFMEYDWPGNTRELYNKVRKLEVLARMVAEGDLVTLARSIFTDKMPEGIVSLFDRVEQFERQLLTEALLATSGNKSEAARLLGIHEATVRQKLRRHRIFVEGGVAD
jgi:DNA-binding NtrC family response regulator/Tfp pilus assembly protein PilF